MKKIYPMFTAFLLAVFLLPAVIQAADSADLKEPIEAAEKPEAAPPAAEEKAEIKDSEKNYKIQAGDKLNIKIFPEDQYIKGGEVQVSPEGNIILGLLGKVNVTGLSIPAAVKMLEELIDKDYLADPEVSIEIMESKQKSFVILGQIKKPGTMQFPAGSTSVTLLEAISMAGGFSDIANVKKIKILRQEGGSKRTLSANAEAIIGGGEPDVQIQEGDVINVSESLF